MMRSRREAGWMLVEVLLVTGLFAVLSSVLFTLMEETQRDAVVAGDQLRARDELLRIETLLSKDVAAATDFPANWGSLWQGPEVLILEQQGPANEAPTRTIVWRTTGADDRQLARGEGVADQGLEWQTFTKRLAAFDAIIQRYDAHGQRLVSPLVDLRVSLDSGRPPRPRQVTVQRTLRPRVQRFAVTATLVSYPPDLAQMPESFFHDTPGLFDMQVSLAEVLR